MLPDWDGIDPARARQLEDAIRLGMATDPARRPATPGELVERLRAGWEAGLPTGVVTVCCSEIDDAARLWDPDPKPMAEALVRHDELIAAIVERGGGRVVRAQGESGATVSVFDSATQALEAAVAAQRALADEPWPAGLRLRIRWGIHTGEGIDPAAALGGRVRAQADAGQILLTQVAAELVAGRLPGGWSLVALGAHRLTPTGAPQPLFAVAAPGIDAPPEATACPYRGLLAFEHGDARFFFGREAVVDDLLGRIAPGHLVAVVGASGAGKSSVLRAGVVAAVEAGRVPGVERAVVVTPAAAATLDVPDDPAGLLVVDQLEELFTRCDDPERRSAFVAALLERRGPVAVGLRADLYGRLGAHPELARAIAGDQVLLGAMTREELERAVTAPAGLAGLRLEPGLTELIVRDVATEPGALPMLSHALRATWELRDGRTLTVDGYRGSGGVASAIARTADAVVDALPAEQRALARGVFLRMTELGEGADDSRRRVPTAELVPEGTDVDAVAQLLARLADARLVTLGDDDAEVAHEALIREWPRLRGWLEEDRDAIRAHRRLGDAAALWEAGGRDPSDLLRGARLAAAVEVAEAGRVRLNATERAFVDAGAEQAERERRAEQRVNRRLRGLLAGALVLLVVAIAAGVISLAQRGQAQDAEAAAEAQALRADAERLGALGVAAPRVEQSLLQAVAGVELQERLETRSSLLTVLQRNPAVLGFHAIAAGDITAMAVAPDERVLVSGDDAGAVRITDMRTWTQAGDTIRLPGGVGIQSMAFAPDSRRVAIGVQLADRYEVHELDVATRRTRRLWSRDGLKPDAIMPTLTMDYAPGGRRLALGVATPSPMGGTPVAQRIVMLGARDGRVRWQHVLPMRPEQWEPHVGFASERTLVSSAQQGETILWDARTGRIKRRFGFGGRLAVARGGRMVALALNSPFPAEGNSKVALLDLRTGGKTELAEDLTTEWLLALEFTEDGKRLAVATANGTVVWDLASGAIVERFGRRVGDAPGIEPAGDGAVVVSAGAGAVGVWDVTGARRLGRRFEWASNTFTCTSNPCAVTSPSEDLMATTSGDGRVAILELGTGALRWMVPARNGAPAEGLAFTADGRLITGGFSGTVRIWDIDRREVAQRLRYDGPVYSTAVSSDGALLAATVGSEDKVGVQLVVRDLPSERVRYRRDLPNGAGELAFSADGGAVVASGCCRGGSVVAAYDARSGRKRFVRRTTGQWTSFALHPDSRRLLVGDGDGRVAVWDLATGVEVGAPLTITAGGIAQIAVAPDGLTFAVGGFDNTASLWDIRSRKRIGETFPIERATIPAVAFDRRGRLLITELGSAILWPVDVGTWRRFACEAAGGTITRAEWADLLPSRPYRRVCAGG